MQGAIFHVDGDAFFVGCEVAKDPRLKGLAVVTGEDRGIVTAASYEAKALGVTRGMPIFKLKKEFPKVLVLPSDYQSYANFSRKMFDVVRRYTEDVEEYSIDECFADLTGWDKPFKLSYKQMAERIKKEITSELGLSVSVGLAPTKVLAKVASKWQKPNGLTVIEEGDVSKFLSQTSIETIWGIGPRTSESLKRMGINTAQDLAVKSLEWIEENLSKPYQVIWHELNSRPVMKVDKEIKDTYSSIQKTHTFHPATNDKVFLLSQLSKNIESATRKARFYNLVPKSVSFFLKTREFHYLHFDLPLALPTNAPEIISSLARINFNKFYDKNLLYRTTGVVLHDLVPMAQTQLDLFGGQLVMNKLDVIHKQIDNLEEKFGRHVVYLASTHKALKRKTLGTDAEDLDRDLLFL